MLTHPLPDLPAWTRHLCAQPIPVLAESAAALAGLAAAEEERGDVDAHRIAAAIAQDPLMALRVFAQVARLDHAHGRDERRGTPETVTAALVLLGIGPFFRAVGALPTVETVLDPASGAPPGALAGLQRVLRRAYRAANFALGFAVHRMDGDAPVIQAAALLHDFAELLLWCHAPALALAIARRQADDPALRSVDAQQAVLNVHLADLELALMRAWALPELLTRMVDERCIRDPRVHAVDLAVRIARHSQDGWDNPALPDDWLALAGLLNLSPEAARELVLDIDA